MTDPSTITETRPADLDAVLALYHEAFPEEELRPLVRALHEENDGILSLTVQHQSTLAGHILFTLCDTGSGDRDSALLGPLAVRPAFQRQGLGRALIAEGVQRLQQAGIRQVFVLGDPGYYGQHGFAPEQDVLPPYPLPEAWRSAWQSRVLAHAQPLPTGQLRLPAPWMKPALWLP